MRSSRWWVLVLFAPSLLVACDDTFSDAVPARCHFESGRPCPPGQLCMGTQGNECNYYTCTESGIIGSALGCSPGTVAPVAGGPFNCDPATIEVGLEGGITPAQGGCPLTALRILTPGRAFPFGDCVPVQQCRPIACDPAFNGDGCPSGHGCDATSRTCVALASSR